MGKSSPPPPDYTPMANASREAAATAERLGNRQLDLAERQYDDLKPLADQIAQQQINVQDRTMQQGEDYYNYLKDTYRPLEKGIVQDAQNFNTEAYRNQLARKAAADSALAFQQTQKANERSLMGMGVNPNSGRFAAAQQGAATANAAQRAALMNQTRQQADATGYARQLDSAGLGRNLSGASTGAYGLAVNSGTSALNSAGAPGQQQMQGFAQGAGTIMQGQGQKIQGLGNVLSAQTSVYGQQLQNQNSAMQALGSGLGTALGGWATGGFAMPGG